MGFADTEELMEKQRALQTAYISNENHVMKAQTVAEGAKSLASKANSDLYALNSKFRTVSESLTQKEDKIGSAKDRALGLQRRATSSPILLHRNWLTCWTWRSSMRRIKKSLSC